MRVVRRNSRTRVRWLAASDVYKRMTHYGAIFRVFFSVLDTFFIVSRFIPKKKKNALRGTIYVLKNDVVAQTL